MRLVVSEAEEREKKAQLALVAQKKLTSESLAKLQQSLVTEGNEEHKRVMQSVQEQHGKELQLVQPRHTHVNKNWLVSSRGSVRCSR